MECLQHVKNNYERVIFNTLCTSATLLKVCLFCNQNISLDAYFVIHSEIARVILLYFMFRCLLTIHSSYHMLREI